MASSCGWKSTAVLSSRHRPGPLLISPALRHLRLPSAPSCSTTRPYKTPRRSLSIAVPAHHHPLQPVRKMGKKKSSVPAEQHLLLPAHPARPDPSTAPIVDTHTHLISTYSFYRSKYPSGQHATVYDFVRALYRDAGVRAIVDVYCEAPELGAWRELADSALTEEGRREMWGGLEYWFVMGMCTSFVPRARCAAASYLRYPRRVLLGVHP